MPPGKSCPICGRMFGSASLDIHIPQCQSKSITQWRNDPATANRAPPPALLVNLQQPLRAGGGGGGGSNGSGGAFSMSSAAVGGGGGGGRGLQNNNSNFRNNVGGGGGNARPPPPSSLLSGAAFAGNSEVRVRGANTASASQQLAALAAGGGGGALNLVSCKFCSRKFSSDRIGKHESVCVGSQQARSAFDAKKQRLSELQGEMGIAPVVRRRPGAASNMPSQQRQQPASLSRASNVAASSRGFGGGAAPKRDWRSEHLEFQAAIRAAKREAPPKKPQQQQQQQHSQYGGGGGGGGRSSRLTGGALPRGASLPRGAAVANQGRRTQQQQQHSQPSMGGVRPMMGGPGGGGGGGGGAGAPRQINILPTNDTSAGMWQAMGRAAPSYGTDAYGPIGARGGAAGARMRAQQQQQVQSAQTNNRGSGGFW